MLDYNNNMELNAMKREREPWSKISCLAHGVKPLTTNMAMCYKSTNNRYGYEHT